MFTPNELKEISFDKAVFGGYDMGDVDKAFAAVSEDYATLFKENTMLKKKLKLLADTVEDYRSVDEAMRKALITAQNMANEMVADAEKKSREMLSTAEADAKAKLHELNALVAAEEKKLTDARAATAAFIDNTIAVFSAESEKLISVRDAIAPIEAAASEPEPDMSDTLDEISKSLDEKVRLEEEELARKAEASAPEKVIEPKKAPVEEASAPESDTISLEGKIPTEAEMAELEAAAEVKSPRRHRVEFENLKFGTDYKITDDE